MRERRETGGRLTAREEGGEGEGEGEEGC